MCALQKSTLYKGRVVVKRVYELISMILLDDYFHDSISRPMITCIIPTVVRQFFSYCGTHTQSNITNVNNICVIDVNCNINLGPWIQHNLVWRGCSSSPGAQISVSQLYNPHCWSLIHPQYLKNVEITYIHLKFKLHESGGPLRNHECQWLKSLVVTVSSYPPEVIFTVGTKDANCLN